MRMPSPSMIVALVALFVALSGVGVAANGRNFILGHSNSATLNTALSAPVAGGKALQVTNNNTTNAASTALGLNVAAGHAPFTVNSSAQVKNLNASYLGGINSSGFVQGTGHVDQSGLIAVDPGSKVYLGPVSNFGGLWGNCENANAGSANVVLEANNEPPYLFTDGKGNFSYGSGTINIPIVINTTGNSGSGFVASGTHTATISASAFIPFGNPGCEFFEQNTSSG